MTDLRPTDEFVALGHAGPDHYAGLETFENPGISRVEMTSDELTAVCPITGQPDLYPGDDRVQPPLALPGIEIAQALPGAVPERRRLCEALAVRIRDDIAASLDLETGDVTVTLRQKARGGITITATA